MRDLRERLDRELERIAPAPGARAEIRRRALRRRRRNRAILVPTTLLLAGGLIAGLTYAFTSTPDRGPHVEDRGSERARLMTVHVELEGLLGHIWTVETHLSQVRRQIDDAQREIRKLFRRMGSNPTEEQREQLASIRLRIGAWKRTIERGLSQISLIEAQVAEARVRRDELIPPSDASVFPDVAEVTCDGGEGPERTRLSTPVVAMRPDGVHLRVTNRMATHEMYVLVQPGGFWTIPAGGTRDILMPPHRAHDAEIACAYCLYIEGWQGRPTHPLWIAGPDACPASPFTVSRLPWLEEGSEVPAPELIEEGVGAILVWFEEPTERWSGRYVALKRSTMPLDEGLSEFPTVRVRGVNGRLVWIGDPGVGELALTWKEGDQLCRWYTLSTSSVGLSQEAAEEVIRDVAASIG
jgi:hypothetical protein